MFLITNLTGFGDLGNQLHLVNIEQKPIRLGSQLYLCY